MAKFFVTLFFVTALVLTIWTNLFSSLRMRIFSQDISRWKLKLAITENPKLSFETLVLGDSSTDTFISPKFLPGVQFNMSLGGGTSIDGYVFLSRYLKHHAPPKRLIISYAPISMMTKDEFYSHTMMLNFFTFNELKDVGKYIDKMESFHYQEPELPSFIMEPLVKRKYFNFIYLYELLSIQLSISKYQLRTLNNLFVPHVYQINQGHLAAMEKDPNVEKIVPLNPSDVADRGAVARVLDINQAYMEYFKRIIELAEKHNIKTYFIMTPVNIVYKNYVELTSYGKAYEYFKNLEPKYSHFKAYKDAIYYPSKDYLDTFHSAPEGTAKFTKFVNEFISKEESSQSE